MSYSNSKQGTVVRWVDEKGFGFIHPEHGIDELFFHIRDYRGQNRPQVDDQVFYILGQDQQGRPCAKNIQEAHFVQQKVAEHNERSRNRISRQHAKEVSNAELNFMLNVAIIYYAIFSIYTYLSAGILATILWGIYTVTSIITFIVYWLDKSKAQNDQWRIPEATLHVWALIGGWIGATFAHKFLNHKSTKQSFRNIFYISIIVNAIVFLFVLIKLKF